MTPGGPHSRIAQESLDHDLVEENRPKVFDPDTFLLSHRFGITHPLDVTPDSGEEEGDLSETQCPAAVTPEIEVAAELIRVGFPVRIRVATQCDLAFRSPGTISYPRREERRELCSEKLVKVRVTTLAKDHPEVGELERLDSGELELQDVALTWVHICKRSGLVWSEGG